MKKITALAIALLVIGLIGITGTAVMADETLGSQAQMRAKIHTMGALGNGLAISQTNPMDFELLKVGIAGVSVTDANGTETIVRTGVLHFGETKYRLKDVVIGNGTATANVYDINGTNQLGSISLNSYVKGDKEIWAGTLTLGGVSYNAYVIQAARLWKAVEKAEKVKDYCENNPEKCKAVMKALGNIVCDPAGNESCRDRIKAFCESHPDDNRCKALTLASCALKLDDANCRQNIIEYCKNSTNSTACDKLANMYGKYDEKKVNLLKNAPQWFQKVRERIKNKLSNDIESEDDVPELTNGPHGGPNGGPNSGGN